jgi:hypothetical protein
MEIALIPVPTLALLPYGIEIKSVIIDDDFIEEMKGISDAHGFWAQTMSDVIDQFKVDNHTETVLKRMISSVPTSTSCDPARAVTKNLRSMTFTSSPFVDVSLLGKNTFGTYQEEMRVFFCRNPTPARMEDNDDDEDADEVQIPVISTTTTKLPPPLAPSAISNPPPGFYAQLIETMKNIQAHLHPSKIVVKSRDYKDTIDLAKLQNGMLQLMYATGDVTRDDGIVNDIQVATFSQGFLNLLARSASVQATKLQLVHHNLLN